VTPFFLLYITISRFDLGDIFYSSKTPVSSIEHWIKSGVESVCVDVDDERVNLANVLDELGKRGVIQLLVEGINFPFVLGFIFFFFTIILKLCICINWVLLGGAELHSEFLKRQYVDELAIFYGACVSTSPISFFFPLDVNRY